MRIPLLSHLRALLLAGLALALSASGIPQSGRMVFRSYGPSEGLEHISLTTLSQDAAGFLWVGTEGGAYRFDGTGFRLWSLPEGLPSAWVRAFGAAPDGRLWIGTRGGLCFLQDGKVQTLGPDDPLAAAQIHQILLDAQGQVWVAAESGLFRGRAEGPFRLAEGWPGGPAYALTQEGPHLWVGGASVLRRRDGEGAWRSWTVREGVPPEPVKALLVTPSGTLWARTPGHLRQLAPGAARLGPPPRGLPPLGVAFYEESLCPDGNGGLFVPTAKGLLQLPAGGPWRLLDESRGLPSGWANQTFIDRSGNLWVASLGLHRLQGKGAWENITQLDGLPADSIWGLLRDRAGVLWAGTSGGLARLGAKGPEAFPPAAGLVLYALKEGPDGSIWGAGEHPFLLRISPDRSRVTRIPLPPSPGLAIAISLAFDRSGALWVGTTHDGLWRLTDPTGRARFQRMERPGDRSLKAITALHEDSRGRLWAATGEGLACLDQGRWRLWGREAGFRPAPLSALAVLPDGTAWVAYREPMGITQVDLRGDAPRVMRQWTRQDGLASDSVYSLAADPAGRLWVGGPRGVQRLEGSGHRLFRREDGLASTDCNPYSTWVDPDGGIWFGSTGGLLHHHPGPEVPSQSPPGALFVSFRLGARHWERPFLAFEDLGDVRYGDRTLAAHFTSLAFEHEGRLRFQARLAGLDEDWVDLPTRDLRYPTLPPGPYRLDVRALIEAHRAGPVASVAFRILPPWWRRWWAWSLWGGLAACTGLAIIRWRVRLLRRRNEELKTLVYQRTEALELSNLALATISTTDPLTGLRNRRYLEGELPPVLALVQRAQRDRQGTERSGEACLVFAMIDLDHFKRVNDTWSHAAGDLALKQVADVLKREARESDFLIRWGGEEILFVGHTADLEGAATVVARLHQALRGHPFDLGLPAPVTLTCSIGFSLFPFQPDQPEAASWEDQVRLADRCLYAVKRSGRDGWAGVAGQPEAGAVLVQRFEQTPALCIQSRAVNLRSSPREGDLTWD